MISFPNSKINLGLYVVEKRPDGYHNIETIFYPVKLCDALEMVEADKTGLSVSGIVIDGDAGDNLILKAYHLLQIHFDLPPVQFHLHKVIPFGAGLGGGSADAAFTLKMLNDYFELNIPFEKLENYAAKIGADCTFFVQNKPSFACGIGNVLKPLTLNLNAYKIVLVKPNILVSTPKAYQKIIPRKANFNLQGIDNLPVEQWKGTLRNDFEESVFLHYPEVESIKKQLYEMGAVFASMSGSGSAVFGIFNHVPEKIHNHFSGETFVCEV